jgi:glutamate synthase (ferredoxin)
MKIPAQSILQRTLYDPWFEHDGCGIGFVARISGEATHDILAKALAALSNLEHRSAVASDALTGDGAGVLTQIPRALLLDERERNAAGTPLPPVDPADLAVGMLFLPQEHTAAEASCRIITDELQQRGLSVIGWRDVPTNDQVLGQRALEMRPLIRQVLIARGDGLSDDAYERTLFLARKAMEAAFRAQGVSPYIPSLSSRTIVYKGLLMGSRLSEFYLDLVNPAYVTPLAVYHARYSTNTFPAWERAQPFRMISHNGEINTLQGNVNWMRAREKGLRFPTEGLPAINGTRPLITPVVDERGSDSAMFDNVLELLVHGGRDIRHAMTMMAPEAWEKIPGLDPNLRAFYLYHTCLMEPWDGPAALTFSDGRIVGTALDRNGLRPSRYRITSDGLVISGSEAGVVALDNSQVIHKGNLGPGQMIAVDTATGQFFTNDEIKQKLAAQQPYSLWIDQHIRSLDEDVDGCKLQRPCNAAICEEPAPVIDDLQTQQMAFGYTREELNVILKPMQRDGKEPVGSMGDDTPMAVMTQYELGRPLYQFFKQRFAEVTNPPIDPLREEMVMSLYVTLGKKGDLLDETPEHAHLLRLSSPIITDAQLAAIHANPDPLLRTTTISTLMPLHSPDTNGNGHTPLTTNGHTPAAPAEALHASPLRAAIARLCQEAEQAASDGAAILVLSDRGVDAAHAPIPALLALGAVHHHLIRAGLRGNISLIVESGEPREVHHVACLVGYGAKAVNPYLALASVRDIAGVTEAPETPASGNGNGQQHGNTAAAQGTPVRFLDICGSEAERHFVEALEKGLLKIMSKMGISPVESYSGAQIFEAVGISPELIERCFTGTPSRIGGISFEKLEQDMLTRHRRAFEDNQKKAALPHPGFYKFKKDGEYHAFSPAVVHAIHKAVRYTEAEDGRVTGEFLEEGYRLYQKYADLIRSAPPGEPRNLMEFVAAGPPIPLDEVEPIEAITKRFSTAAMSHGALSSEAHETLAIALNRLGGKSNSGEGGEAPERYTDERRSRIKQVASGRFGVTPTYLANADVLQIKMAQGSKPGEGGQLPGHKVSVEIARNRYTVPGVSLISPPPHHDIYSIEDLAQLIYDLKQTNPDAAVSVKLVATAGVGTIAAGVAKGYADEIHISGGSGGTGASPLSSIKNAGISWELGLAETQQTLVFNGLRERVRLTTDGGFQTGRDVVIGALLGADEFSFGTIAMVAEGCVMARACHANTCPVGVATQREDLRAKFPGTPEMVMVFFRYMAQEIRELLASLGLRSLQEAIGRADLLRQKQSGVPGADLLDLAPVLVKPATASDNELRHGGQRNIRPEENILNDRLIKDARAALSGRGPVELHYPICNCDRTVGARVAGAIGQMYGAKGLPEGTVRITFEGSAGQSFGAFNAPGMHLKLIGEANDYVGKGMAGGEIIIRPSEQVPYAWRENTIAGNTILYGATGGELYLAGRVGQRFAVRNSGAVAVVEGTSDHACEYMTGGTVLILGPTGRNLGAGMTGGVAYVLDEASRLPVTYNDQLVRLDRLNQQDETRVRALLQRHLEATSSAFAAEVLQSWQSYAGRFWRVMPREAVAKIEATSEGTRPAQEPATARETQTSSVPA